MRLVTVVFALFAMVPFAFAEDDAMPSVAPSMKTSIEISKALTPAQKIAALEDGLNKETDRRVEMQATVESQKSEIARLVAAQVALNHEKTSAESELGRTREALTRAQRDFETLRAGYAVVTKIIGYSYPVIAALILFILVLLGWLLVVTRRLAVRVHDVPTLRQMHTYQENLGHVQEQLAVEKNRTAALKERLSMLGVVD
jgi:septal ring factor EnvC (AmiA/AmiB activator)